MLNRPSLRTLAASSLALGVVAASATPAVAELVTVRVTNVAPENGLFLTPVFVTFHDGSIDLYDEGAAVSAGFERLAEDGSTQFLADEVTAASGTAVVGALPGGLGAFPPPGVLGPGMSTELTLDLDPSTNRFFSYASMVIPSNDAFVSNDDPTAFQVFDADGNLQPLTFDISGSSVLDAGTEVNTEVDVAFLDQTMADAGTPEGGVVTPHEGLNGSLANPDDAPVNILGGTNGMDIFFDPTGADFSQPGYTLATVEVFAAPTVIPTPAALPAGLAVLAGVMLRRRRA